MTTYVPFWSRFWRRVQVMDESNDDSCWEWCGYVDGAGRAKVYVSRQRPVELAHRVAFELVFGYLPDTVLHDCDNPKCVRPDHLEDNTQEKNIRDAVRRGRLFRKLDVEKAHSIKQEYVPGTRWPDPRSLRGLAAEYSVDRTEIWKIVTGQDWPDA